jgi:ankyrin repeat protein
VKLAYVCYYATNNVGEEFLRRHREEVPQSLYGIVDMLGRTRSRFGMKFQAPPLGVAMFFRRAKFFQLLLRHGANPNIELKPFGVLGKSLTTWRNGPREGERQTSLNLVSSLLQAGAEVNPLRVSMTPLQVAIQKRHSLEVIIALVEAGADVNGVGDQADTEQHILEPKEAEHFAFSSSQKRLSTPLRLAEDNLREDELKKSVSLDLSRKIFEFLRKQPGATTETRNTPTTQQSPTSSLSLTAQQSPIYTTKRSKWDIERCP